MPALYSWRLIYIITFSSDQSHKTWEIARCKTLSTSWLSLSTAPFRFLPTLTGGEALPLYHPPLDLRSSAPPSRWVPAAENTPPQCLTPVWRGFQDHLGMVVLHELTPISSEQDGSTVRQTMCSGHQQNWGNKEEMENEHGREKGNFLDISWHLIDFLKHQCLKYQWVYPDINK